MSVIQLGLVDTTGSLNPDLVQSVAAALNIQVTRDLPQFWDVKATVIYLPSPHKIPAGVWPVQLVKNLPPGEGGFHLDKHKQPYAKVIASPQNEGWTIASSHETLEMLVDPYGNRLQSSVAIKIAGKNVVDGTGQFGYLVEACDPCEDDKYAYTINGVVVSDFITPHYYDLLDTPATRYSFTGSIKSPRQLLPGGYISFVNHDLDEWQQIQYLDSTPKLINLGKASADKSLREWIDGVMQTTNAIAEKPKNKALHKYGKERRAALNKIAIAKAKQYA
ncbi:hypothetical protein [Alloacidobacterium sp.]|uniref:hypothetical protein n=1 Tax=Alloacidobacterium sp. TaxID=2951999 RepID=UPI002D4147E2|nr:hypothetical protein [Alloacidobacterium sp.]HYK35693.1 hypothetical protein [Alloacidobacterium sp.]